MDGYKIVACEGLVEDLIRSWGFRGHMFNLKGKIKSLIASNKLADGSEWGKRFSGNKGKKKIRI